MSKQITPKVRIMKPLKKTEALMLRTCRSDGSSSKGLIWPKSGPVACEDWKPEAECGHGLHGLLWGEGDGSRLDWSEDAAWLVVRINIADAVNLRGQVKVPSGVVEFFGERFAAVKIIQDHAPKGSVIVSGTATAGYRGTATAGYSGTATAGYSGTATAGYYGTATAGYRGTATAGDYGTATAGYRGTATAGYRGTATAGDYGTATAGEDGVISIRYWNGEKYKRAIFAVGENGIEPNIPYRVDETGKPFEVKNP